MLVILFCLVSLNTLKSLQFHPFPPSLNLHFLWLMNTITWPSSIKASEKWGYLKMSVCVSHQGNSYWCKGVVELRGVDTLWWGVLFSKVCSSDKLGCSWPESHRRSLGWHIKRSWSELFSLGGIQNTSWIQSDSDIQTSGLSNKVQFNQFAVDNGCQ